MMQLLSLVTDKTNALASEKRKQQQTNNNNDVMINSWEHNISAPSVCPIYKAPIPNSITQFILRLLGLLLVLVTKFSFCFHENLLHLNSLKTHQTNRLISFGRFSSPPFQLGF